MKYQNTPYSPTPKHLTFTLSNTSDARLTSLSHSLGKTREDVAKEAINAYMQYLLDTLKKAEVSL